LPLFTIDMARGMVDDDHELVFGYADPSLNPVAWRIAEADVILLLGKNLDFRLRFGSPPFFAESAALIQVEPDTTNLGRNRELELGIVADVGSFVAQLVAAAEDREWNLSRWTDELRRTPPISLAALAADGRSRRRSRTARCTRWPLPRSSAQPCPDRCPLSSTQAISCSGAARFSPRAGPGGGSGWDR